MKWAKPPRRGPPHEYRAYITGTGDILNYITFADPLNEFALFVTSSVMGIMLTALAVSYKQENC